jgi:hypothetical protein
VQQDAGVLCAIQRYDATCDRSLRPRAYSHTTVISSAAGGLYRERVAKVMAAGGIGFGGRILALCVIEVMTPSPLRLG